MEYLVTMTTHVPDGTSEEAVQEIRTREAARSAQLATEGHLLRLWRAAATGRMAHAWPICCRRRRRTRGGPRLDAAAGVAHR